MTFKEIYIPGTRSKKINPVLQRKLIVIFHMRLFAGTRMGTSIGILFKQTSCLIWQLTSVLPLDCFNVGLRGRRLCRATSIVHASLPNPRHSSSLSNTALYFHRTHILFLNIDWTQMLCSFTGHNASFPGEFWDINPRPSIECLTVLIVASQLSYSLITEMSGNSGVLKHVQKCYPFLHLRLIPANSSRWGLLRNHLEPFHAPFSVTSVNKVDLFLCFVCFL